MALAHFSRELREIPWSGNIAAQRLPESPLLVEVWVILDRPPNDPFLRKKEPFTSSFLPGSRVRGRNMLEADYAKSKGCMSCVFFKYAIGGK